MRAAEDVRRLMEISFPRKLAELKIRGKEETANENLVKLLALEAPVVRRMLWKKELVTKHFNYIAAIRVRPNATLLPARDLYKWLYADPFEGNEAGYTSALISMNEDEYPRNQLTPAEVAVLIKRFYEELAPRLAQGDAGTDLVAAL